MSLRTALTPLTLRATRRRVPVWLAELTKPLNCTVPLKVSTVISLTLSEGSARMGRLDLGGDGGIVKVLPGALPGGGGCAAEGEAQQEGEAQRRQAVSVIVIRDSLSWCCLPGRLAGTARFPPAGPVSPGVAGPESTASYILWRKTKNCKPLVPPPSSGWWPGGLAHLLPTGRGLPRPAARCGPGRAAAGLGHRKYLMRPGGVRRRACGVRDTRSEGNVQGRCG